MNKATMAELTKLVLEFRAERDWAQFHTPKELAISLVVESAELLELMQWKQGADLEAALKKKHGEIADELADCLHSILLLAHEMKIDLVAAFREKLKKVAAKYPVEKAKGKPNKYNEL
ncbi:MAG: nucleotide pyrophosphohydrolase [Bacillota bacterium]